MDDIFIPAYNEWQRRIAACMAERGFKFISRVYEDEMQSEFHRSLNPLNEQTATVFGYHPPDRPEPVDVNNESTEAYMSALDGSSGDPTDGCGTSANIEVYRELNPLVETYQLLLYDLDDHVSEFYASDVYSVTLEFWTRCMAESGFSYSTREEPYEQFVGSREISPEEILVRLADLECDKSTRFTERRSIWERVQVDAWNAKTADQWPDLDRRIGEVVVSLRTLAAEPL